MYPYILFQENLYGIQLLQVLKNVSSINEVTISKKECKVLILQQFLTTAEHFCVHILNRSQVFCCLSLIAKHKSHFYCRGELIRWHPKNVRSVTLSFILDFDNVIADEIVQLFIFVVVPCVNKQIIMKTLICYMCRLQSAFFLQSPKNELNESSRSAQAKNTPKVWYLCICYCTELP